jgi:hypothetical protein
LRLWLGHVLAGFVLLGGCFGPGCWTIPDRVWVREAATAEEPRLDWASLGVAAAYPEIEGLLRTPHPPNTLWGYGDGGWHDESPERAATLRAGLAMAWSAVSNATLPAQVPLWSDGRAYTVEVQSSQQECT